MAEINDEQLEVNVPKHYYEKKYQRCDLCDGLTGKCEDDKIIVSGKILCDNCFDLENKLTNISGEFFTQQYSYLNLAEDIAKVDFHQMIEFTAWVLNHRVKNAYPLIP